MDCRRLGEGWVLPCADPVHMCLLEALAAANTTGQEQEQELDGLQASPHAAALEEPAAPQLRRHPLSKGAAGSEHGKRPV